MKPTFQTNTPRMFSSSMKSLGMAWNAQYRNASNSDVNMEYFISKFRNRREITKENFVEVFTNNVLF